MRGTASCILLGYRNTLPRSRAYYSGFVKPDCLCRLSVDQHLRLKAILILSMKFLEIGDNQPPEPSYGILRRIAKLQRLMGLYEIRSAHGATPGAPTLSMSRFASASCRSIFSDSRASSRRASIAAMASVDAALISAMIFLVSSCIAAISV